MNHANGMEPPQQITSGYPEKLFRFLAWELVQTGGRRAAARNRTTVLMPVYQAEDGEKILLPQHSKKLHNSPSGGATIPRSDTRQLRDYFGE